MWYKLKRILIYPDGVTEKQVYPWLKTLTFDFANDWQLNFTKYTWSLTMWYTSGSWISWYKTDYTSGQLNISPNSDFFSLTTLKRMVIDLYLPSTSQWSAWWIFLVTENQRFWYALNPNETTKIWFSSWSSYNIGVTKTWNVTIDNNFEWNTVSWTVWWVAFSITDNLVQSILSQYADKTLKLHLTVWSSTPSSIVYLKKITLYWY